MKTGDILELAEVVRNLSLRDSEKGLSTGEKQMFVKAKKILASELMYAKDMDEEEAAEWLDGVLVGTENGSSNGRKKTTAAKPAKVASKTAAKPAARKTAAKPAAKAKPTTKARASSR
jgi:CarD family transcriptional regulator